MNDTSYTVWVCAVCNEHTPIKIKTAAEMWKKTPCLLEGFCELASLYYKHCCQQA